MRPCLLPAGLALSALLLLLLAPRVAPAGPVPPDFYRAEAAELAQGAPGSLIRYERMDRAPQGAEAYRILYRSQGLRGETIAVSGVALVPTAPAPPEGRPVVAWAHPTSGVAPQCAPSLARSAFEQIQGVQAMLAHGELVVATDYPGLGTPGPHPYLVGDSEGRAVLDAVRAVWRLPDAFANRQFAVWGHSQGGQAALFAGRLAAAYAPELRLVGVAAAAPATALDTLLREDVDSDGGRNLTAMTLWSWSRVYGAPLAPVLDPAALPTVDALAGECIESLFDVLRRRFTGRSLAHRFLRVPDLTRIEPWRSLLVHNIPGTLPPEVPLLIVQGDADDLVRPAVTEAYARRLCAAGSAVRLVRLAGVGHGFAGRQGAPAAADWIAQRFAGRAPPNDCPALQPAAGGAPLA